MIQQSASMVGSEASIPSIYSIPLSSLSSLSSIQSISQLLPQSGTNLQKSRLTLQKDCSPLRDSQLDHAIQLRCSKSLEKWEALLLESDSNHASHQNKKNAPIKKLEAISIGNQIDDLTQQSIQEFLRQTQTQLSHYFTSIHDAKNINTAELQAHFITAPIEYARIKATAEKAFTDSSYAKDHPRDGCYARAELGVLHLDTQGKSVGKIFVTEAALVLQHPSFQNVAWNYHVAVVAVSKEDHQLWVIDPCVSPEPVLLPHWLEKFVVSDSVKLTFTHASYRYTPKNFIFNLKPPFERIEKAKAALNALAKTGCAHNDQSDQKSESSFGYYAQFSEDQQMYDQLLAFISQNEKSTSKSFIP